MLDDIQGNPVAALREHLRDAGVTPDYVERIVDPGGTWSCQGRALGLSAQASGHGKKAAKRAATQELLKLLKQGTAMQKA